MHTCIIIAALWAGEEQAFLTPGEGGFLICADRGYEAAKRFGLSPDLIVGDFDSMPTGFLTEEDRGRTLFLPRLKDDTDTAVCVAEGRKRGYWNFRVGGGLGGRLDHTAANLQLAADCALRGESLWLCDAQNRATVLEGAMLTQRRPLGVSNEWTAEEARLSFEDGLLAVFFSGDA